MADAVDGRAAERGAPLGVRVVAISDTHGSHRQLQVPDGDVLIHAGDFTRFGRASDVADFNDWLGTLEHPHKIVVNGNHEVNADWNDRVAEMLPGATFLCDAATEVAVRPGVALRVYGTQFRWSVQPDGQSADDPGPGEPGGPGLVPGGVDVLVCHNPALGYVDGGVGCPGMARLAARVCPRLFVCGHIHDAHGVAEGRGACAGTTFVNAANAGRGHGRLDHEPIVLDL